MQTYNNFLAKSSLHSEHTLEQPITEHGLECLVTISNGPEFDHSSEPYNSI
jgi:hypothetical protein